MNLQERLNFSQAPLFLMDGSAFIYRGFYANRTLQRSDGFPTNALYVVTRILLRILREQKPTHFVFVLDGPGKNFRHDLFPLYKANRKATPEELVQQIDPIKRMVTALGLRLEVTDGFEADDCIASLANRFAKQQPVVIVSGDKDLKQCLAPNVVLWDPAQKEEKITTAESFTQETGLQPHQWADVQALIGDSSDNIPGVPGIGPKSAEKIFATYSSLEDIQAHLLALDAKLRAKLEQHLQAAFLYRDLARLDTRACQKITLDTLQTQPIDQQKALGLLQEFELLSLRRELESMLRMAKTQALAGTTQQMSLFDMTLSKPAAAPVLTTVTDVRDLPPCTGVAVALFPASCLAQYRHTQGYCIGVADAQYQYTGQTSALQQWASAAECLVTPSVKHMLHEDAAWHCISIQTWFDMGLAAYLCDPEERDYSWPRLSATWSEQLDIPVHNFGTLALALHTRLGNKLRQQHLDTLYYSLEMPLIPVLAQMEHAGIAVDLTAFKTFLVEVQQELDNLTQQVYAAAGEKFNIRSAQQLGTMLFKTLQLPSSGKTPGGQLSTAQASLEKLAGKHPIVDALLAFRKLEKLRSTYLEPLPRLVDTSGRIHTTFNQCATATGRLSSSNPNLQNIPVRGAFGKRMRRCFVAAPQKMLVSADYSQVELRVLAHMSQDAVLLDAFRHNQDIHTQTAALIFDTAPDTITPEQRRNAKTINFGLIYGMGAQKLAQELHITTNEAKAFITHYFEHLTKLKAFYERIAEEAATQGYVTTLAGRRRYIPDIHSSNSQAASLARRQAINTVIQGSAADIIKLAMLAVVADPELKQYGAQLVLQVHDELLVEVTQEHVQAAAQRIIHCMSAVAPGGHSLDIPLVVDAGTGKNWGEAH